MEYESLRAGRRPPYIAIKLFYREYHALIDTGCAVNFVNKLLPKTKLLSLPKFIGYDIHESPTTFVEGYKDIWITIQGISFRIPVIYYYQNCGCDILLGMSFLNTAFKKISLTPYTFEYISKCGYKRRIPLIHTPTKHKYQSSHAQRGDKIKSLEEGLAEEQFSLPSKVKNLIQQCYSENPREFKNRLNYKATIELLTKTPVYRKPMKYSYEDIREFPNIIEKLLKNGLIRPSRSPWNCPGFLVRNHSEIKRGEPRLVINYKPLNQVVKDNRYPLPRKDVMFEIIRESRIFSKFDCKSGFFQIELEESSRECTAFSVPQGQYEWNVLPMGLKTAPSIFQERMDKIFSEYRDFICVYIDDILVHSKNIKMHKKHLFLFAVKAYKNGLVLSEKKSKIGVSEVEFLGLEIKEGKIQLQPNIIRTILKFPSKLTDKKNVQQFLGHLNYASEFVPYCAKLRENLQRKLRGNKTFVWEDSDTEDLKRIKEYIQLNAKPLPLPKEDDEFIIETDASDLNWGAVLRIKTPDKKNPVCRYQSGTFKKSEINYDINEKEVLAVKRAIEKFESWILQKPFEVHTDNKQVKSFIENKAPNTLSGRRRERWQAFFSYYTFTVKYISGKSNVFADFLSRNGADL